MDPFLFIFSICNFFTDFGKSAFRDVHVSSLSHSRTSVFAPCLNSGHKYELWRKWKKKSYNWGTSTLFIRHWVLRFLGSPASSATTLLSSSYFPHWNPTLHLSTKAHKTVCAEVSSHTCPRWCAAMPNKLEQRRFGWGQQTLSYSVSNKQSK